MSVLTDPATYGILNGELTNCPWKAAALGELANQWQQMMGSLQRVEQETVTSQNLLGQRYGEHEQDTDRVTPNRLRLKDGERVCPKSWSGSTSLARFSREVAAWLG